MGFLEEGVKSASDRDSLFRKSEEQTQVSPVLSTRSLSLTAQLRLWQARNKKTLQPMYEQAVSAESRKAA